MPNAGIADIRFDGKAVKRPAQPFALGGERFDDFIGSGGVRFGHALRIICLPKRGCRVINDSLLAGQWPHDALSGRGIGVLPIEPMNRRLLILAALLAAMSAAAQQNAALTDAKPVINLKVIEGVEVKLPNRSIIYQRVEPPAVPPKPVRRLVTAPPTPEQTALAEARAKKKFEVLMIFATVYDHRVTGLCWWSENRAYHAWSNVDFNYLAGHGEIETEDAVYLLIMGLGNESAESIAAAGWTWRKELPSPERFNPARAEYFLSTTKGDPEPPPEALAAINSLHRYYDANRTSIADEYTQREAARIAREKALKESPPAPKDTVINFWPKKSRVYPTGNQ